MSTAANSHLAPILFGAKRKDNVQHVALPNNKQRLGLFLGRGTFTNAFLDLDSQRGRVYLFVQHGDLSKDILSHIERANNKHIPVMHYLGAIMDKAIDVYKTQYYNTPVTRELAGDKTWGHIKALQKAHAQACTAFPGNIIAKKQCVDFNYYIADKADVPGKIKEALCLITESAQDWGEHYLFDDFRGDNLALDGQDRLVFTDAMFDAEKLQNRRG